MHEPEAPAVEDVPEAMEGGRPAGRRPSDFDGLPALLFEVDGQQRVVWAEGENAQGREGERLEELLPLDAGARARLRGLDPGDEARFSLQGDGWRIGVAVHAQQDRLLGVAMRLPEITGDMPLRRTAEDVDRRFRDLLNRAAHELSTPLTPIRLRLHSLLSQDDQLSDPQRRAIQVIERNFLRVEHLVEDFLETERMAHGASSMRPRWSDTRQWLRESLDSYVPPRGRSRSRLKWDLPPDGRLHLDADRMTRALHRLLDGLFLDTADGTVVQVRGVPAPGLRLRIETDPPSEGSSGHNLSNVLVDAIVQEHGGSLERAPGGYDLRLPPGPVPAAPQKQMLRPRDKR